MATGIEIIKTIKKQNILSNVQKMGKYLLSQLGSLPVENPRGLGLMAAFDLDSNQKQQRFRDLCFQKGLIILHAGLKTIRLIPPYIIKKGNIDECISVMEEVLKKI